MVRLAGTTRIRIGTLIVDRLLRIDLDLDLAEVVALEQALLQLEQFRLAKIVADAKRQEVEHQRLGKLRAFDPGLARV